MWRARDAMDRSFAPPLDVASLARVARVPEALDFYVDKLGLEVSNDLDLGFMRWLTVRVPGPPDRDVLLERPGPPAMERHDRPGPRAHHQGCQRVHGRLHDVRRQNGLRSAGWSHSGVTATLARGRARSGDLTG